jgi:hypothetical protein
VPQVGHTPWVPGLPGLFIVAIPSIEKELLKLSVGMQILLALAVPLVLLFIRPVKDTTVATGTLAGIG